MIRLLILLFALSLVYALFQDYNWLEPYINYNLPANHATYYRNPLYYYLGIQPHPIGHSTPHYSTHHTPAQVYAHKYAWNNYFSNIPIHGYIDRLGIISTPPLSHNYLVPPINNDPPF